MLRILPQKATAIVVAVVVAVAAATATATATATRTRINEIILTPVKIFVLSPLLDPPDELSLWA